MARKIYKYESLGETLDFAESLGWIEPEVDEERTDTCDALEEAAIEFIERAGYEVTENSAYRAGYQIK
jgi:adenylate cyclase class IV